MAQALQELGLQHLRVVKQRLGRPGERQTPDQWEALTSELFTLTEQLSTLQSRLSKIVTELGLVEVGPQVKRDTGTLRKSANTPNPSLRYRRKMQHWTQADVADELYQLCSPEEIEQGRGVVNANMVGGWERGEHRPSRFWQKKLCMLFGTTPDHLGLLQEGTRWQ